MMVCEMRYIQWGDLFVASGLGLRFPVGYPVGIVMASQHTPGNRFATIVLQTAAHVDRTQHVLLVWPNKASLASAVQKLLKSHPMSEKDNLR